MDLAGIVVDALDPAALQHFWSDLLDGSGFLLRFVSTDVVKTQQNQAHLDLTSTSLEDQQRTVARVLELGGRHLDIGQTPGEGHVVMADPEGNELCIIEPGNGFLAGCPFFGCLSSVGTHAVGVFWSEALGWPLVWDQGEETAIQPPGGGPKISWGGWSSASGSQRWRLEVTGDVEELVALGAVEVGVGLFKDPDGNPFHVR